MTVVEFSLKGFFLVPAQRRHGQSGLAQFRILGEGVEHANIEGVRHLGRVLFPSQLAAPLKGRVRVPSDQARDLQVLVEQRG